VGELLPYLPYDSGAMRSLASTLRRQVAQLANIGSEITGAGRSMTFDGPAGDRIRTELAQYGRDATHAADGLQAAAGKLESAATDVDNQNAAITRHNQAVLAAMPPMERKLVLEHR
jgi:uncharacterized protein YukE